MTPLGTERGQRARTACIFCGTHHAIENSGELFFFYPSTDIFQGRDSEDIPCLVSNSSNDAAECEHALDRLNAERC